MTTNLITDIKFLKKIHVIANDIDPVASHPIVANGRYVECDIDWNEAVIKARSVKATMLMMLDKEIKAKQEELEREEKL